MTAPKTEPRAAFASDTSGRTPGEWGKALLFLLAGLCVAHLGVTLYLLSDLGSNPFTMFAQGLARTLGLSVGVFHVLVQCVLIGVMLLTTKGYIKPGTVVCALCGGPIIDGFTALLGGLVSAASPMAARVAAMAAGCVIMAAGMTMVMESNAGTGADDLVAIILADKCPRVQFRWMRVACDALFMAVGWALGGTIGLGTVAAVALTGPLAQFFLPYSRRLAARFLPPPKPVA